MIFIFLSFIMKMAKGYVYILTSDSLSHFKIGTSVNVKNRLKSYKTSVDRILKFRYVASDEACRLEKDVFEECKNQRIYKNSVFFIKSDTYNFDYYYNIMLSLGGKSIHGSDEILDSETYVFPVQNNSISYDTLDKAQNIVNLIFKYSGLRNVTIFSNYQHLRGAVLLSSNAWFIFDDSNENEEERETFMEFMENALSVGHNRDPLPNWEKYPDFVKKHSHEQMYGKLEDWMIKSYFVDYNEQLYYGDLWEAFDDNEKEVFSTSEGNDKLYIEDIVLFKNILYEYVMLVCRDKIPEKRFKKNNILAYTVSDEDFYGSSVIKEFYNIDIKNDNIISKFNDSNYLILERGKYCWPIHESNLDNTNLYELMKKCMEVWIPKESERNLYKNFCKSVILGKTGLSISLDKHPGCDVYHPMEPIERILYSLHKKYVYVWKKSDLSVKTKDTLFAVNKTMYPDKDTFLIKNNNFIIIGGIINHISFNFEGLRSILKNKTAGCIEYLFQQDDCKDYMRLQYLRWIMS